MDHKRKIISWQQGALCALLLASIFLGLRFGSTDLGLRDILAGLLRLKPKSTSCSIVWVVRLPRVAGCVLAGAALAVSGLLLQTAANNPLAGPNVIGVNAGAGFAMVLGLCFVPELYRLQPLMAFAGAFGCTLVIVSVAERLGSSRSLVVLTGVAVSALLNAGISMLKLMFPDRAVDYNSFAVGGVSGVAFSDLFLPAVLVLAVLLTAAVLAPRLNLLCLGDSIAANLGVRVKALRIITLLLASAAAAAAVSFAGLLGFVGLMVPHIARRLLKTSDVRRLLPACTLMGAILVVLADLLGRVLAAPSEIPAGIITACIGAPFFFALLLQRRNRL